jgi:succinate dehydrogenase subunit D
MPRSREPFFWVLFSGGGTLAALLLPALVLLLLIFIPAGLVEAPSYRLLVHKLEPPLVRLSLFVLVSLSFFHWGHRFRYTLYDGLQLDHLYGLIAAVCYGGATILTVVAARVLWAFP